MKYGPATRKKRGMLAPIAVVIVLILSVVGFAIYNYMRFERNLVARLQYSSVAEKFAQAAAFEAANIYNCKVLSLKNLDANKPFDRFILAPVLDRTINGVSIQLTPNDLKSFGIIAGLKGTLDMVELKYEGFANYFKTPSEPSDFSASCVVADDPFERFGGLVVTSKATCKTVSRSFKCRYEIKIANTLVPVLSKFTFFTMDKDAANENQIEMTTPGEARRNSYGGQGLIEEKLSPPRVPLVMIHHPEDIREVNASVYLKNHAEIREYLPLDESVTPAATSGSNLSYRPQMANRGWVYLGAQTPDGYYLLNTIPGKVNPDLRNPYPQDLNYLYYGAGFTILESDFSALIFNTLKGDYPYKSSFVDARKPEGVHDYILRLTQCGIYWIARIPQAKPVIGNFYAANPSMVDKAALLQPTGDIQAHQFASPIMPSKYMDRRSPTIVFGQVIRSFAQIVNICQNCVHQPASPGAKFMMDNGMHKVPYDFCAAGLHPKVYYMCHFNIDENNNFLSNPANSPDHPTWEKQRFIDDAHDWGGNPLLPPFDFAPVLTDVNDIFKISDAEHVKTYKFFMTNIMFEPFNKSYDWIVANSRPAGGVIEPGKQYALKQERIKILNSYPAPQPDELFFYREGKNSGNCMKACNLKISQYRDGSGNFTEDPTLFPDGIFRGALGAINLSAADYKNPMLENKPAVSDKYDIRHKASHIFNNFSEFSAALLQITGDTAELKDGGVFYIDSDETCDLSCGNSVKKISFHDNAMLIFKNGVKLPAINKSSYAKQNRCTLTIVSIGGDLTICGAEIEASLNALNGTIKKELDYFQIFGNMTMKKLNFDLKFPGSLFKVSSFPRGSATPLLGANNNETGFTRASVMYDPALNPCDAENYTFHYRYYVSSRQTYWRFYNE